MITGDDGVIVDGIVHCWDGGFIGRGSGGIDNEVKRIVWLIRVAKEVETEGRGRIKRIVGGLLWTIKNGFIWAGFKGIWGLNALFLGCAFWDRVLDDFCAAVNPEDR